ncbi:hypothetical protein CS542_05450 [Pedobacter sp. IW39]|nr:hypothetical protein CS542_05450 [Pedobacter sp. IW39]
MWNIFGKLMSCLDEVIGLSPGIMGTFIHCLHWATTKSVFSIVENIWVDKFCTHIYFCFRYLKSAFKFGASKCFSG